MLRVCLGAGVIRSSPSSQPEEMGFMFHSVCMKEASTWSSPLAVDRCWRQPGGGSETMAVGEIVPEAEAKNGGGSRETSRWETEN